MAYTLVAVMMHIEILDVPVGLIHNHKNNNGLDNHKSNLRICSYAQNQHNLKPHQGTLECLEIDATSGYKGICWDTDKRKWRAVVCHKSRSIHIGYYDYQADVEITYDNMAVKLLDEFVYLNFQYRPEIKEWLL